MEWAVWTRAKSFKCLWVEEWEDSAVPLVKEENLPKKLLKLKAKTNSTILEEALVNLITLISIISETWALSAKSHNKNKKNQNDV